MTMMSMDIGDDNAMMNIIWNGGNSETHPVSQLVPLTCLNPAFKIHQSCQRCQYCLSSSSKESSLSLHQDLYDLFSRLIRVSSSCSCSLLLSPCFPDHDGGVWIRDEERDGCVEYPCLGLLEPRWLASAGNCPSPPPSPSSPPPSPSARVYSPPSPASHPSPPPS